MNFGSCNIDYVYSLTHLLRPGETQTARKLEIFPGGKGLNQSIAAARAGAKIYHAGCVGSDGDMLLDILKSSTVDTSYTQKLDGKSGHAIIQLSASGENSIFVYRGTNEMIEKDFIRTVLADFDAGDIILLQNEINNIDYIIKKAYEKGMCIILNPAPFNEELNHIDYNMISYLILNEVEIHEMTSLENHDESLNLLMDKYPELRVVLTLGENGCVYIDKSQKLRQPAFIVEVADTTAAGDTFIGYFAAGLCRGSSLCDILRLASAASAVTVSGKGAAPSIPKMDKVQEALKCLCPFPSNSNYEQLRRRINEYISQNIKSANLNELAQLLGYSSVYTGDLVKKLTDETFTKLLQRKRCALAASLLADTELSVKEIIETAGYTNESFFRTLFKETYGKKPLEYRKHFRN